MSAVGMAPRHAALAAAAFILVTGGVASAQERPAAGACNLPHEPGTTVYVIDSGGREREFVLVVPGAYDGANALPAVLALHGSGSGPEEQLALSGMAAAAEERNLLVIAPRAATPMPDGGFTWNVPPDAGQADDVAFVRDVLNEVAGRVCVDASRVYASGFSGGARLVSELGCALADRIAAVGAVGGLRHPPACGAALRPVPVVAMHGTADSVNPYEGGGPPYWGAGVDEALRGWAAQHGADALVEESVSEGIVRLAYVGSDAREYIVLYRLDGIGHVWPGSPIELPDWLGPTTDAIDATALMLDFFAGHRLR